MSLLASLLRLAQFMIYGNNDTGDSKQAVHRMELSAQKIAKLKLTANVKSNFKNP